MSGTYAQTWVCGKHYPHDEPEEQPASEDCPWCQIARLQTALEQLAERELRLERALSCIQVHLRGVPLGCQTVHEHKVYEYARAALEGRE